MSREEHECPHGGCERSFGTEYGVKQHHAKTHDEKLREEAECDYCGATYEVFPGDEDRTRFCSKECKAAWESENKTGVKKKDRVHKECRYCGEEFKVLPCRSEQKFCSKTCNLRHIHERDDINLGELAGEARKRERTEIECEYCGGAFEIPPWRQDRARFCSQDCLHRWRSENESGDDSIYWKGRIEIECEYCGDAFEIAPWRQDRARFCSQDCLHRWRSENERSKNHSDWKGGYRRYYSTADWKETAQQARESDGYACQACGISQEEHVEEYGRKLEIHHIKPLLEHRDEEGEIDYEVANNLDNLVSLCSSCHTRYEGLPVIPRDAD